MGTNVGPTIVQDSLVINLDRDNPNCVLGRATYNQIDNRLAHGTQSNFISRVNFDGAGGDQGIAVGRIGDRQDVIKFSSSNNSGYIGVLFNMDNTDNAVVGEQCSLSFDLKWISGRDPSHDIEAGNETSTNYTWKKHPTVPNVEYHPSNGTGSFLFTVYGDGYKQPTSSNTGTAFWMYRVDLGDGWYRYKFTYTAGYAGRNQIRFNFQQKAATRADGVATAVSFYIDNIQYEKGWPSTFTSGQTSRSKDAVMRDSVGKTTWTMDVTNDNRLLTFDNFDDDGNGDKYRWDGTNFTGLRMSGAGNWDSSPNNNVFTVCGWVKADEDHPTNVDEHIFQTYNGDSQRNRVVYSYLNERFQVSGGYSTFGFTNGTPQAPNNSAPRGVWNHYAVVFDLGNGTCSLYTNGEHSDTVAHTCPTITMANVALGMYNDYDINNAGTGSWAGSSFKGQIAIFHMYHKALSPQEVKQNFEAHRNRFGV